MIRWILNLIMITSCWLSEAQAIKTISFNIRYANESDGNNRWELRKNSAVDFVRYEEPDFMGLQEALISQIKFLANNLENYTWMGVGRDDGKTSGEFSPLFYNATKWKMIDSGTFWLSESPDTPSKSWDAALPRICTWGSFQSTAGQDTIYVFNTHYDHIGEVARLNASGLILQKMEAISAASPVVLIGDFNAEDVSPPISAILESPLVDSYKEANTRFGSVGTFNGYDYQTVPAQRIDYVFVSQDFIVNSYMVNSMVIDGRYLSDHFPVIVQLTIK